MSSAPGFADVVNPTVAELRAWAAAGEPEPMQDFDLIVSMLEPGTELFDLIDAGTAGYFFLHCLYIRAGELVGGQHVERLTPLIEVGLEHLHRSVRVWAQRSADVIADPSTFDYRTWCGGGLAANPEGSAAAESALDALREAGIAWAAGGSGQPLVDAAAAALAAGADTPMLRLLAGALKDAADEDASAYAPPMFYELGFDVKPRGSAAACIEGARQQAQWFLDGELSARELTRHLEGLFVFSGHLDDLECWSAFDDYYELARQGVLASEVIDARVESAALALVTGRPAPFCSLATLLGLPTPKPRRTRLRDRITRVFRRER